MAALDPRELQNLKVLAGIDLATIQHRLEQCEVRALDGGEVLLAAGQANRMMYMILSGRMSVHLEGGPKSDPVAFIEAGETVGELSVLDSSPASAFVVAAAPTRVLCVTDQIFWGLVDASHDFSVNLLLLLARRLRKNNSTVDDNIRLQREYQRNAMVDALTGLYNRRWLEDALPRFVKRYTRSEQPLALLMVDVDHFKRVNDEHGHASGDNVLVSVSHTLRSAVRPTDFVARYGGEEFAVILPDTGPRSALGVAERLRVAVKATPVRKNDGTALPPVTISIGGTCFDKSNPDHRAIVEKADGNLYTSKQNGRDRVTFE